MRVEALGDTWRPADLPELPPRRWVHIAPLARGEFPVETLAALARRYRVSFDGQGLVRVPRGRAAASSTPTSTRELLRHIWVLKLAEEEAEVIGDVAALGVREVLVTHGSRGSTIYVGGTREDIPARPLDRRSDRRGRRVRDRVRRRAQRGLRARSAPPAARPAVVASLLAR